MRYEFYINPEIREETLREAGVTRLVHRQLEAHAYEQAYVLPSKDLWVNGKCPGGVVTAKGEFIEASAWHEGDRCCAYDFNADEVLADARTIIYMGFYNPCWGHAITDNLKKLWFLDTEECHKLLAEGAVPVYLTIGNQAMPAYIHSLFSLAGVNLKDFEHITELTCFRRVIIPDNSFIANHGQRFFTEEYRQIITRIKSNVSGDISSGKIYFTRTRLGGDRERGEKDVEKVFKGLGYKIIAPETKTPEEQIGMLMNCTAFAATEGSISHNAVFCSPGTPVTIIRKCNDVNKYQMAVNEVANVNVTYIDAHKSIKTNSNSPWAGPFFICINKNLERWAGHQIFHLPLWMRLSWWQYLCQEKHWYKKACVVIDNLRSMVHIFHDTKIFK